MSSKRSLALGLMSGTSADGVSVALVELSERLRVLANADYPYSAGLRKRILGAAKASVSELSTLSFELGRLYAEAAVRFLKRERVPAKRLAAVGSHGQTVIHLPDERIPSTLQIGEPSFLAERLGVPVVSDFRPRDMAAGGQGAPLVPFLDDHLFGDGPPRALQNIGGVGNVALAGKGVPMVAFDTGPGNSLIDLAAARISRGRLEFDRDGRLAARGVADWDKAESLLRHPYFSRRPPKSLDRGAFGEAFLARHFGKELRLSPYDAIATITDFTAASIADSYKRFLFPKARVREVVISGGGALNPVLLRALLRRLAPLPVRPISDYGIPALAKEPAAFALMALHAVWGKANHLPAATGARGTRVLGKISR